MPTTKPRYPARFFYRLREYPLKHCAYCGEALTPKLYTGRGYLKLESVRQYQQRRTCNSSCGRKLVLASRSTPALPSMRVLPVATPPHPGPLDDTTRAMLGQALRHHAPDLLEVWPHA